MGQRASWDGKYWGRETEGESVKHSKTLSTVLGTVNTCLYARNVHTETHKAELGDNQSSSNKIEHNCKGILQNKVQWCLGNGPCMHHEMEKPQTYKERKSLEAASAPLSCVIHCHCNTTLALGKIRPALFLKGYVPATPTWRSRRNTDRRMDYYTQDL